MPVSLAWGVQTGTQKEVFFTFSRFVFRSVWMALDSCWGRERQGREREEESRQVLGRGLGAQKVTNEERERDTQE